MKSRCRMFELFDKVFLKDGTAVSIVEVFGEHEAYEVETADGDLLTVSPADIDRRA